MSVSVVFATIALLEAVWLVEATEQLYVLPLSTLTSWDNKFAFCFPSKQYAAVYTCLPLKK